MTLDVPTAESYEAAFREVKLTDKQRGMLQLLYEHRQGGLTATEAAEQLGYKNRIGAQGLYGNLAGRIREHLAFPPPEVKDNILCIAYDEPCPETGELLIILRPEVVEALENLDWFS